MTDDRGKAGKPPRKSKQAGLYPFRAAVLRGLGVVLPPLLTIVIFLWISGTVEKYLLDPVLSGAEGVLVRRVKDVRHEISRELLPPAQRARLAGLSESELSGAKVVVNGEVYVRVRPGKFIPAGFYRLPTDKGECVPQYVWDEVGRTFARIPSAATGEAVYAAYVRHRYLNPYFVIPAFLSLFILALYLLGKFMAAGMGRFFWGLFERGVSRVPLVRNVYGAVKQVSDFVLSERELEYSRVVAVEWPRKGIWSMALVTGESMIDIEAAANEPVLSVLIPTSPMPMTGFTMTVKKSETIDLSISFDEAIQFIVSCGVVVPQNQLPQVSSRPQRASQLAAAKPEGEDASRP